MKELLICHDLILLLGLLVIPRQFYQHIVFVFVITVMFPNTDDPTQGETHHI